MREKREEEEEEEEEEVGEQSGLRVGMWSGYGLVLSRRVQWMINLFYFH
jgi:hypothetical protein